MSGNDLVYYEVTTTYTDSWEVTFTYYHNSLGYTYLYDESVPRHVGRSSSSSREEIRREAIDDDTKLPGSGNEPSEPVITEPGSPETTRPPRLTAAERAEMKRDLALQRAAGSISEDAYEKAIASLNDEASLEVSSNLRRVATYLALAGAAVAVGTILFPGAAVLGVAGLLIGLASTGVAYYRWQRHDISGFEFAMTGLSTVTFLGIGKLGGNLVNAGKAMGSAEKIEQGIAVTRVGAIMSHPMDIATGAAGLAEDRMH